MKTQTSHHKLGDSVGGTMWGRLDPLWGSWTGADADTDTVVGGCKYHITYTAIFTISW